MAAEQIDGIEFYVDVDTAGAVNSTKVIDNTTKKIEGSFKKLDTQVAKSSKAVRSGIGGMGRQAGQAGIQFQQFIGQIQGGQNAMVALSAQSADLGFVLGAPLIGAIVGIGASIIGMAAAFGKAEVEMKSTSDIAKELVGDFSKLDAESQKLARGVIESSIRKQEKALNQLKQEQVDYLRELKLFTSTEEASEKYKEYTANILSLGLALDKSKKSLSSLGKDTNDYSNVLNDQQASIGDLITSIVHLGNTYGFSARELSVYEAELLGANEAQIAALNLSFDTVEAKEAEAEATKKQAKAERDLKSAKEKDKASLTRSASGVADRRGDPLTVLADQKQKELDILRNAEEQGLQLHSDYASLRSQIDEDYAEKERLIREQKFAEESKFNELALGSIDALGVATTDTLSGLLSGTYSATEAMQQFSNTILNSALGALVEVGVQYLKNALISQTADKAILASQLATKSANATAHTIAVSATVAELTALAAAGAFASTAAIPFVGLGLAPAAAATAAAATAGLGAAAVSAAPIAGARFDGGDVSANSLYEVGEKNRPEMLMIPGNNGKVFSNAEMKSAMSGGDGGGGLNVKVINLPGQTASVTQQGEGVSRETVIQIISEQSAQLGTDLNRNINKNHNVTNRQSANRRN